MVCAISCSIAFILIIANAYCCSFGNKTTTIKEFISKLSPENQQRYRNKANERRKIYFTGLFLGFALSMLLLICCRTFFISNSGDSRGGLLCMVAAVTLSVNYFYYILSPKTDWMVLHLKSEEEKHAWLKVYKTMQYNYHMGLVLGILAVVAFGNALCS
ncbi:MAG: hypothetical protein WCJ33_05950 [Pseudomonadota bacterium]